jgi:hypothetical protein
MRNPGIRRWDAETAWVAAVAALVSIVSFLYYLRHGDVLLYGDAVAHINIARRVFDSQTPGFLQLGTVWLPLPHLLMIPFLVSDWLWQTGVGGSIPSLLSYVAGAVGIFRLVRSSLSWRSAPDSIARAAAWLAALVFLANPNLIYLQSTAMTEPLYLALFIWTVVHLNEFAQIVTTRDEDESGNAKSSLWKCGLFIAAACLTRYDGWCLAVAVSVAVITFLFRARRGYRVGHAVKLFLLTAAAVPVFWLAYNAIIYRNPLEFADGPYSAHAIEQRTLRPGEAPHPGTRNLPVAASYVLKAAQLNLAANSLQRLWILFAVAGTLLALAFDFRLWPLLLLWLQLPFYMLSVAYSGVPIFMPEWWPFSFYNVRYGIELLPAFAVFLAFAAYYLSGLLRNEVARIVVFVGFTIFVALSYSSIWRAQPICFQEALVNSRTRVALEQELGNTLKKLPPHSMLLMYLGDHVGALQHAGIPLQRVIYEGNHRTWKHPSDPDGLWEKALANPAEHVDFVIAMDGDAVAQSVRRQGLIPIAEIHAGGQPNAVVYRTK